MGRAGHFSDRTLEKNERVPVNLRVVSVMKDRLPQRSPTPMTRQWLPLPARLRHAPMPDHSDSLWRLVLTAVSFLWQWCSHAVSIWKRFCFGPKIQEFQAMVTWFLCFGACSKVDYCDGEQNWTSHGGESKKGRDDLKFPIKVELPVTFVPQFHSVTCRLHHRLSTKPLEHEPLGTFHTWSMAVTAHFLFQGYSTHCFRSPQWYFCFNHKISSLESTCWGCKESFCVSGKMVRDNLSCFCFGV